MMRLKLAVGIAMALFSLACAYDDYTDRKYVKMAASVFMLAAILCILWSTWKGE